MRGQLPFPSGGYEYHPLGVRGPRPPRGYSPYDSRGRGVRRPPGPTIQFQQGSASALSTPVLPDRWCAVIVDESASAAVDVVEAFGRRLFTEYNRNSASQFDVQPLFILRHSNIQLALDELRSRIATAAPALCLVFTSDGKMAEYKRRILSEHRGLMFLLQISTQHLTDERYEKALWFLQSNYRPTTTPPSKMPKLAQSSAVNQSPVMLQALVPSCSQRQPIDRELQSGFVQPPVSNVPVNSRWCSVVVGVQNDDAQAHQSVRAVEVFGRQLFDQYNRGLPPGATPIDVDALFVTVSSTIEHALTDLTPKLMNGSPALCLLFANEAKLREYKTRILQHHRSMFLLLSGTQHLTSGRTEKALRFLQSNFHSAAAKVLPAAPTANHQTEAPITFVDGGTPAIAGDHRSAVTSLNVVDSSSNNQTDMWSMMPSKVTHVAESSNKLLQTAATILKNRWCSVFIANDDDSGVSEVEFGRDLFSAYNCNSTTDFQFVADELFVIKASTIHTALNDLRSKLAEAIPAVCLLFADQGQIGSYKSQILCQHKSMFLIQISTYQLRTGSTEKTLHFLESNFRPSAVVNDGAVAAGGYHSETYPMNWDKMTDLCHQLASGLLLAGSVNLIRSVVVDGSFLKRVQGDLSILSAERLAKIVRLATATSECTSSEFRSLTAELLLAVLASDLLRHCYDRCVGVRLRFRSSALSTTERTEAWRAATDLAQIATKLIDRFETNRHIDKVFSLVGDLLGFDGGANESNPFKTEFMAAKVRLKDQMNALDKRAQQQQIELQAAKSEPVKPPPDDFRSLLIFPCADDMRAGGPYLRANRVEGAYDDSEHYLDVHFRLLREDYIHEIREGILQLRGSTTATGGNRNRPLVVYEDVTIAQMYIDEKSGAIVHPVSFRPMRLRWLKRLQCGSLVCLSNDGFHDSLVFATVFDRRVAWMGDVEQRRGPHNALLLSLEEGEVALRFENPELIDFASVYRMIESVAYFEAYRHVLKGLQEMKRSEPVPFYNYLVDGKTESVGHPQYLIQQPLLNFAPLLKRGNHEADANGEVLLDVFHLKDNVDADSLGMDESQFEALNTVLNNEIAIVQGPPGTGKTYLGHQVTKLLLANDSLWCESRSAQKHPMLIVCYTNHALDQFLEGVAEFTSEIVRVGGKSKSEKLKPFMLHTLHSNSNMPADLLFRRKQTMTKRGELKNKLEELSCRLQNVDEKLPDVTTLELYLERNVKRHLDQLLCVPSKVLCWLTEVGNENDLPLGGYSSDVVHRLMATCGLDELYARRALYISGQVNGGQWWMGTVEDAASLVVHQWGLLEQPCPEVDFLPSIIDIHQLIVDTGCSERTALVALLRSGNWLPAAFELLLNEFNGQLPNRIMADVPWLPHQALQHFQPDVAPHGNIGNDGENDNFGGFIQPDDFRREREALDEDNFDWEATAELNSARGGRATFRASFIDLGSAYDWLLGAVLRSRPMPAAEQEGVEDVWNLPLYQRWQLYAAWVEGYKKHLNGELEKTEIAYIDVLERLTEIYAMADLDLFSSAKVIAMTTTAAAKHQATLQTLQPRIVIVEEAAELFEAHIVSSITNYCEHLILIGDHKQLRPKPSVHRLAVECNLDVSLFERLLNNRFPYAQLKKQHRTRPEIARPLMPHFYEQLDDHDSVKNYPHVNGLRRDIVFYNHTYPEEYAFDNATSPRNGLEAQFAVNFAWYLLQQQTTPEPERLTILCCYFEQMLTVRKMVQDMVGRSMVQSPIHAAMRWMNVTIVDNYQGEENDIVILSLVRSNNDGKIGFLSIKNRMCVALSRAKRGLYVLGNFGHLRRCCDEATAASTGENQVGRTDWPGIIDSAKNGEFLLDHIPIVCQVHGKEQNVMTADDFAKLSPEGGCLQSCNERLDCGHVCEKPCHSYSHKHVNCFKDCVRTCSDKNFSHICKKRCYEDCGECRVKVERTLECNHVQREECCVAEEDIVCQSPCERKLPCGHGCSEKCGLACTARCGIAVEKHLPCGHTVEAACCIQIQNISCTATVTKQWRVCGHKVEVKCCIDPETDSCPMPCGQPLSDCQDICEGTCGRCFSGRLHIRCQQRCRRILVCGHVCQGACSQNCPPCMRTCENACFHSVCASKRIDDNRDRLCGDPCPRCAEPCVIGCEHRRCSAPCGSVCQVVPCEQRCQKILSCGHCCIGTCGDPCPLVDECGKNELPLEYCRECVECQDKCGICRPCRAAKAFEKLTSSAEMLFGTEDEPDAIFVQLQDCKHTLEASGLDHWIKSQIHPDVQTDTEADGSNRTEIGIAVCPLCKTPIRRTTRYARYLSTALNLIEQVKAKVRGRGPDLMERNRQELIVKLDGKPKKAAVDFVQRLQSVIRDCSKNQLTLEKLQTWENLEKICDGVVDLVTKHMMTNKRATDTCFGIADGLVNIVAASNRYAVHQGSTLFCGALLFKRELKRLISWLNVEDFNKISGLMVDELASELYRLNELNRFCEWLNQLVESRVDVKSSDDLLEVWQILFGQRPIEKEVADALSQAIRNCIKVNNGGPVSKADRVMITKAMKMERGHWYRCPKGHVYAIGECGRAMQIGVCPECGSTVGGEHHRLDETNQSADEVMFG